MTLAVFGYGSLASPVSAAATLGRPVEPLAIARLQGWRRRWTVCRDNNTSEKTFALPDGTVPPCVVGLNLEPDPGCGGANGVLIEISEQEADRLDLRELRYRRVDVTADVLTPEGGRAERVIAYTARDDHHTPDVPPGAIVIAEYVRAVEAAFDELGPGQLAAFRATTDAPPVDPCEATLVADEIPEGNPRRW